MYNERISLTPRHKIIFDALECRKSQSIDHLIYSIRSTFFFNFKRFLGVHHDVFFVLFFFLIWLRKNKMWFISNNSAAPISFPASFSSYVLATQ